MHDGAQATLSVPLVGPLRSTWEAVHEDVQPGRQFVDRMVRGPMRSWRHCHRFLAAPDQAQPASRLEDDIAYTLPMGPLGALGNGFVASMLERTFAWRHRRTLLDLRRHAELSRTPLVIAVTGASGLVGRALCAFLSTGGHTVRRIVRGAAKPGDVAWDPARGTIDATALEDVDAVVHLAGESIAARWTDAKRRRILESRVRGTELIAKTLAKTLAKTASKRTVLVSASAIGFYGDRGADAVDESTPRGQGFLSDVCVAWESAADVARDAGIRTVHPRIGMVLSAAGGALHALVTPFSLGLGGPVGNGRQGMSWIALDDLIASILFAIVTPSMHGPYNAVAPEAVSNRDFGRTLGRVLHRPAFAPLPSFVVNAIFGAMGRELLLGGAIVRGNVLRDAAFRFDHAELESALRFELGRAERSDT